LKNILLKINQCNRMELLSVLVNNWVVVIRVYCKGFAVGANLVLYNTDTNFRLWRHLQHMNFTANSKFSVLHPALFDRSANMWTGDSTDRYKWQASSMCSWGSCLPKHPHMYICRRQGKWSMLPSVAWYW
jgi:hypothetical protein